MSAPKLDAKHCEQVGMVELSTYFGGHCTVGENPFDARLREGRTDAYLLYTKFDSFGSESARNCTLYG